MDTCCRVG